MPEQFVERELVINKSRFIAWLAPASNRNEALALLAKARAHYPDARHHCYAYLIGNPASAQAAMDDDGEPSGTAGKPIFSVIQHKKISNVVVVVTRYFGGIKLGAGGLVRAYAGAAEAVLSAATTVTHVPQSQLRLTLDFSQEQRLRHWASQHDAEVVDVDYAETVTMTLLLASTDLPDLQALAASEGVAVELIAAETQL